MNDHALHAESAIAEAMRPGHDDENGRLLAAAQAHATLALVHEVRELRRLLGPPVAVAPSEPITAASLLDGPG